MYSENSNAFFIPSKGDDEPAILLPEFIPTTFNHAIVSQKKNVQFNKYADKRMPSDFTPSNDDILCGKGKQFYSHPGNEQLRTIIDMYVDQYYHAQSKTAKSQIVNTIYCCSNKRGDACRQGRQTDHSKIDSNSCRRYFKFQRGGWYQLSERAAKDKIGHSLRSKMHKNSSLEVSASSDDLKRYIK